ncbi:tRNA-guanine(15) transglycosylase-like protein [Stachybotrys elegans]|uniref:Queuine tRNA-ribosyltransferase accessory subunit 2 n=1 Tax=Stachybotrys elegans TaxID=80388 RepID=A0A8K0SQG8_9HYPO|nr:tRNA-guanine(15) transglycosylase-like protein [Stachybotrys elegans]
MSVSAPDQDIDMSARTVFQALGSSPTGGISARLGRLSFPGRKVIETPNFTAATSRGVVPHLTPDNIQKHTSLGAAYMALEDFIEKKDPPIYKTPGGHGKRPLHTFTATPSDIVTVMGARRCPPVATPVGNGAKHVSVFTSTGFYNLTMQQFASAVQTLQPDVLIPLADILPTSNRTNSKKLVRMVDRTEEWLDDLFQRINSQQLEALGVSIFAPVLPVEYPLQWDYLRYLDEDVLEALRGLAIYDVALLPDLVNYKSLVPLPRLSMDPPKSPHDVLRQISMGVDICAVPFINTVSDAGIAMDFAFPAPEGPDFRPMGVNMWSPEHSTSLKPLVEGCQCYACVKHHRAFVQHLLNAKEMLGWNLLQIHNHHVVTEFFRGIRQTIGRGIDEFDQCRQQFRVAYEEALPEGTGARPRARGYHFKSEAGQEKINKTTWLDLNGMQEAAPQELLPDP